MSQPNIIFICADQWRGDCLGLYKNEHPVMTPHLNQLAREGAYFTQAYSDCPICMPQRMTFLTGLTGSELGSVNNFGPQDAPHVDHHQTLPGRLSRELDYQTMAVGKMHFPTPRARYGYDEVRLFPDDYVNWLEETSHAGGYRAHGLGGNELYPTVATVPETHYHSTWIVNEAMDCIATRDPTVPFYLNVIFEAPHSPFDPPAPYDRMYDNFSIADPVTAPWSEGGQISSFERQKLTRKTDDMSSETILESKRRYYGLMSHIDYQLGRLFGMLKTNGLYDNTWIVFTSDHGECLGDHGQWAKHNFLQSAGRVPLLIKPSRDVELQNCRFDTPSLTADIVPTLAQAVGLTWDQAPHQQAKSLIETMNGKDSLSSRVIYGETPSSVMAMSHEHKLIRFIEGGLDYLFDINEDQNDLNPIDRPEINKDLSSSLVEYLSKHERPCVENGSWVNQAIGEIDPIKLGRQNPSACRGPLRYGMGY